MKTKFLRYLLMVCAAAGLAACQKDNTGYAGGDDSHLTLTLKVPGVSSATRGMQANDEHHISTLDILVFLDNGSSETYLYRTHATDIANTSGSLTKQFKALLQKSNGAERHRIVLLANLRDEIDAVEASFSTSDTKEDILAMVQFGSDTKWKTEADAGGAFRALPMWGESADTYIVTASTTGATIGTIDMLRSLARIDVGVNLVSYAGDIYSSGLGDLFHVSDIKVYNTNTKGYAAPLAGNMESATKVATPTAPTGVKNPLPLAYSYSPTVYGDIRGIYVSEADNKTLTDDSKVTCLVVSGYYTKPGETRNQTDKTWYRIDFYDRSSSAPANSRYDILRNHRYIVNITRVDGPGYGTEEEAFNSRPVNIDSEVIEWNDSDIGEVIFDTQYMLGVSQKEYTLGRREKLNNELFVTTDYPQGWTMRITDSPVPGEGNEIDPSTGWIRMVSREDNGTGNKDKVVFAVDANTPLVDRIAYLHITAGRLHCVVVVTQTDEDLLTLNVTPEYELLFPTGVSPTTITPLPITVTWDPSELPVSVSLTPFSNGGVEISDPLPTLTGGNVTFNFTVNPMDPAELAIDPLKEKVSRLEFMLLNEDGSRTVKTIFVRQKGYGLKAEHVSMYYNNYYPLLGDKRQIKVTANTNWVATVEAGGSAVSYLHRSTGPGITTGEMLDIQMFEGANQAARLYGVSTIRFSRPEGRFDDVLITIHGYWGYPYDKSGTALLARPVDLEGGVYGRRHAAEACGELGNGWRLPSLSELRALRNSIGYGDVANNTMRELHSLKNERYWSSTYYDGFLNTGLMSINFHTGEEPKHNVTQYWYVRCVKDI